MADNAPRQALRGARWLRVAALLALLTAGLAVRCYKLTQPPLDFHPTRQYRSALLARLLYLEGRPQVPERPLAAVRAAAPPVYEPPLLEHLAATLYAVAGGERLWIPRLLSILLWLAGACLVWVAAGRLGGEWARWGCTAFFLFLPFAIEASRVFMPDPLMVALLVAVVVAALRAVRDPRPTGLLLLAVAAGGAILVKPMAAFQVGGSIGAVLIVLLLRRRPRTAAWLAAAAFAAALPALLFYGRSYLGGGSASFIAAQSFIPSLLVSAAFWTGWLGQIWKVTGFLPVAVAGVGTLLAPRDGRRAVLVGLWAGYGAFAVAFAYQVHTHDYYHLQLVALVAVAAAPALGRLETLLRLPLARAGVPARWAPALLLVVAVLDPITDRYYHARHLEFSQAVATYEEVGEVVAHDRETIALANFYAYPLEYHGVLAARSWPHWYDLRLDRLLRHRVPSPAERLERMLGRHEARYFVATDLPALAAQGELRTLLDASYEVAARGQRFIVWDLGRPRGGPGRLQRGSGTVE